VGKIAVLLPYYDIFPENVILASAVLPKNILQGGIYLAGDVFGKVGY